MQRPGRSSATTKTAWIGFGFARTRCWSGLWGKVEEGKLLAMLFFFWGGGGGKEGGGVEGAGWKRVGAGMGRAKRLGSTSVKVKSHHKPFTGARPPGIGGWADVDWLEGLGTINMKQRSHSSPERPTVGKAAIA